MELSLMHRRSQLGGSAAGENSLFNQLRKRQLIEALHSIAKADGKVVSEEIEEIRVIAAELGISDHSDTTD